MQKGAAHCGGGAIAGGSSTRVSVMLRSVGKTVALQLWLIAQPASGVDTVINRTDKTLSVSKTVLVSHSLGHNSNFRYRVLREWSVQAVATPFRVPGMCAWIETTCIMTLLSVTIAW